VHIDDQRLVGERDRRLAGLGLHQQHIAVDLLDGAGQALRLRLLRRCGRDRADADEGDAGNQSKSAHLIPPMFASDDICF
jgi:hypothetical protein